MKMRDKVDMAVRSLRGEADSASTPLIVLTALSQDQYQFTGLALGADEFLVKLVSIEAAGEAWFDTFSRPDAAADKHT